MSNLVVLGVVVSIIYYELTGISPGGMIVPGYLVLFINEPERLVLTIIISLVTLLIYRLIAKHAIVYGRRRYALMILISFTLRFGMGVGLSGTSLIYISEGIVGNIIPAILSNDMERQGEIKTIASLVIVMVVLWLINVLCRGYMGI